MDRPDYRTKAIAFQGGIVTIVCQNDNTSSPLLALCNPLLLIGKFSLNTKPGATISEGKLIKLVCNYIKTTAKVEKSKKQVMGTLRRLAEPISCDMTLTSVEHMETSEELQLFKQLGVKVFHGNVVDPKEEELVRAIGKNTYHTLLAGLLSHKAKEDVHLDSSGSSRAISHLEAVNWDLLDGFFTKNSTQLTAYGLQSLKQHLIDTDTTLCVLYWNQHFHVVLQLHGTLLLLQNSLDQFETTVVWRYFDDVNGHGFFMDSKFLPAQTAVSEMDPDGSCTQQKAGSVYVAKSVYFRGRQTFIIYPYMSGSCALVALCNAILLRGDVDLSKMFNCELSLSLPHLHQVVFKAKKTKFYTLSPEEWIVAVGCLHQPVHVNMNFKSIYNIKIAKELEIVKNFGFDLCHGFIADPEFAKFTREIV
jgi:hypothetical protein